MMRVSFDIKLTLNETESTTLAMAAFTAKLSLSDWIKHQLFPSGQQSDRPLSSTISDTVETFVPPPVAAPAPPQYEQTAAPSSPKIVPAAAAVPPPPSPEQVFHSPAPGADVSTPPASLPPPSIRRKTPPGVVPLGFLPIIELGEIIIAARQEIINRTGFTQGHGYVMEMSKWNKANGLDKLPTHIRTALSDVGKNSASIRLWQSRIRIPLRADITPSALLRRWRDESPQAAEQDGPIAPQPASSPVAPSTPSDQTLVYENGRFLNKSLSEHIAEKTGGHIGDVGDALADAAKQAVIEADRFRTYENFDEVKLDTLDSYDARQLRRFTDRIDNLGGASETLAEDKIALAIRKIRGSETGDNPPTAVALTRLCVLFGRSGAFRLRREYVQRFQEVKDWARNIARQ